MRLNELINLGPQPVSHKFRTLGENQGQQISLCLAQDADSGTIQIARPAAYKSLVPDFDWLSHNEPEHHLDKLLTKLKPLLSGFSQPRAAGISSKDASTIDRLRNSGWDTWMLDPVRDLSLTKRQGVESIPSSLTMGRAKKISARRGKVDLLVARHIWEHTSNQASFAESLKELINKDGMILFEVPDCSPQLEANDYTMIWEEHLFYYTPETFLNSLAQANFSAVFNEVFPNIQENINIALVVNAEQESATYHVPNLRKQLALGQAYADNYSPIKERIRNFLREKRARGAVGIFGAGHLTVAFVNYLGIAEFIDLIVDDNINKHGMVLPGTKIPIVPPETFSQRNGRLLLLATNPLDCETIVQRFQSCLHPEFKWFSIFPRSNRFLPIASPKPNQC